MISIIIKRLKKHKSPLGIWTPALAFTLTMTIGFALDGIIPGILDNERYWIAWLGEQIATHHAIPHTLGPESPLDIGRPWIAQEWLFAILVEITRTYHIFPILSIILTVGYSVPIWLSLSECIRQKISANLSFITVGSLGLICMTRAMVRAEGLGLILLALAYWAACGTKKRAWLLLPIFLVWANIHASFPLGIALCGWAIIRRRAWEQLIPLTLAACLTLLNPNGIKLWEYIAWMSHSWIQTTIMEWLPTWMYQPFLLVGLAIPLGAIWNRCSWRKGAVQKISLWLIACYAGFEMVRMLPLASAFGIPAGCAAIGVKNPLKNTIGTTKLGILLASLIVVAPHIEGWMKGGGLARDHDFGLILPKKSLAVAFAQAPLSGRLFYCPIITDCNLALLHGGMTILDGRTDPFPEMRVKAFITDKNALKKYPIDAIITPGIISRTKLGNGWKITKYGWEYLYLKDEKYASAKR